MIRIIKKSIFFLHLFLISNIFADSNTINIFFPLNDDPILDDISAQSFDEDTSSSFNVTATDLNDDSFTFDCVSANDIFCQVTQSTITLTASGNFNGSQTINVSVSDGNGGQDNQDVVVTVNPINTITFREEKFLIPIVKDSFALQLKRQFQAIQKGTAEDVYGWTSRLRSPVRN